MTKAIKSERTLILYVDHTNFMQVLRPDVLVRDIVVPSAVPPTKIPPAATCSKAEASTSSSVVAAKKGKAPVSENVELDGSNDDTDSDFELYDSDYNVEEGDDDLFAENVDKSVNDNNEEEMCEEHEDEDALEDDDWRGLHLVRLGDAAVRLEVVDRHLYGVAGLELAELLHEERALERVGMVEVEVRALVFTQVRAVAVVRVVLNRGDFIGR